MSEPSAMSALAERLRAAMARLAANRARVEDGEPWPLASDFGPEPVPFGRNQADPDRLAAIERDRTLPIDELYARIETSAERYGRRLPALTTAAASRRGLHPVLGELPVTTILERMVVGHAEDHVRQLTGILAGPAAPSE